MTNTTLKTVRGMALLEDGSWVLRFTEAALEASETEDGIYNLEGLTLGSTLEEVDAELGQFNAARRVMGLSEVVIETWGE